MTNAAALNVAPLRGSVSEAEWQARADLAGCCR